MENKIKHLKNLALVRECALNYDYVPNKSEASEIIQDILPDSTNITVKFLEKLLSEYEGNSVNNIENYIIEAIEEL